MGMHSLGWGLLLLVAGAALLAENFDLLPEDSVWKLWPLIIIWWGLTILWGVMRRKQQ